ncbi:MAG: choice-of-anchor tandem repeat GloVer-containing protein [Bryobacteraceae bacterium]|jgi:uncharacterized repeat protein (TIGR03803 family)
MSIDIRMLPIVALSAVFVTLPSDAQTATETILRSFRNYPSGNQPRGTLARDTQGNLYGTTVLGGTRGNGVVFKLTGGRIQHPL